MTVRFHFLEKVQLSNRVKLKKFLNYLIKNEKGVFKSLDFIFCSDDYLLSINRTHLNHDYFTDIITFDLGDPDKGIEGEIYISVDRVADNAAVYSVPESSELLRVIFHGVLHLCGYGDKGKKERLMMRSKEDFYLAQFKFYVPRGT